MASNSGYICENSTEAALWNGWDTLKEYLKSMEDHLQKATEQFEARVSEKKRTLTPELFREFEIDDVEEYIFYHDEFPKVIRNSFFVSAYSLLEYDISEICKDKKHIPINLSDLKGSLLERTKKYCKLAGFDITYNNQTWQEINNYSKVRNCIAHRNGLPKEDDKALIEYIRGKGLIMERFIITDDAAELEIGLTKEFCKEAVDTMQKFIDAAYKAHITKRGEVV